MKTAKLSVLPIKDLNPAEYNPRKKLKPGDKEYEKIKHSIEEFGFADPVVVNSDMTIIGGHQRVTVAAALGYTEVPCAIVEVSKTQEKALNIALNKIIHSSSFYNDFSLFENNNDSAENGSAVQAVKGDVVVPRVGTRCLGKVGIIRNGSFSITDCVFVIKASEYECGEMVAAALKSKFGVDWIKSISKGIGAQYITLNDIKKLPLR